MNDWLNKQLKRGNKPIDMSKYKCCCGKVTLNGFGYYCFKHNKQTKNRRDKK